MPTWLVVLEDQSEVEIKINETLGNNVPVDGKYMIPCHRVCAHRGGKCLKYDGCNFPGPTCRGQFFYFRNRSR